MQAQRGGGVTSTYSQLRRKKEAGDQYHAMATLILWPGSHLAGDWASQKISPSLGFYHQNLISKICSKHYG